MIRKQILEVIRKHKRFLISSHINPEGDSIGSQLALAFLLQAMGKSVYIVNADTVPKNLHFLPGRQQIKTYAGNKNMKLDFDVAVILDCPSLERIGDVQGLIRKEFIINIDHHISNEKFGSLNWVEQKASAAGEMVFGLYKSSSVKLDKDSALCLYVAIMTDTGSFHYSNTTSLTHKIASKLLTYDIEPAGIYAYLYETKSFEKMKLLGEVLSKLQRSEDGKIVWFKVTKQMLKKYNLTPEDTDDFIDFVRMIKGAKVIVFLRELDNGNSVKISLRSKSDIDVNKIANHFGGGGHYLASGCVIEEKMEEAEGLILKRIEKSLSKS